MQGLYTGTAGRIESAQVGVPGLCRAAQVPDEVGFAALGLAVLERARAAGLLAFSWIAGDSV